MIQARVWSYQHKYSYADLKLDRLLRITRMI